MTKCDQQIKIGADQAAEHSKTGIGSGNTWSRSRLVLRVQDHNSHKFKAHLDGQHYCTWMNPIQAETEDVLDNRLNKIHENPISDHWRHIFGKMNPAEDGTQSLAPSDIPSQIFMFVRHKRHNF